jgi:micrococcal nuclease
VIRTLLISLFFFLACACSPDYSEIKVVDVIDGDTIRLSGGSLLRYIGLDTPEIRTKEDGRFVYNPQPFALEAKDYNRRLIEGKSVRIEFDIEKKDKYGRLLGYCFVGDTFVNAELIKEGFAVLYTFPPNVKYVDRFVSLQAEARKKEKGLWGSYVVISPSQTKNYIGEIRTVKGRVLSTFKSAKCIFLNFGSDYKTDFTVAIFNNTLSSFENQGIHPESFYRGKIVEVSGRIREYNGPEIIVNSPFEIEVINDE